MISSRVFTVLTIGFTVIFILVLFNEYYKEQRLHAGRPKIKNSEIRDADMNPKTLHSFLQNMMKQIQQLDWRLKEEEDFKKYKQARDFIIKLLPKLTNNTYDTTFHVLVDTVHKKIYSNRYKVIILVSSNAPNFERRKNIRRLWGNKKHWKSHMWEVFFVTGGSPDAKVMRKLYNEAEKKKDIIIEDVPEDFYNMAKKVMIGLQWAHVNFKYDYILKCDDDVFVHVDNLVDNLKNYQRNTFFGQLMEGQPVLRSGRYGVSEKEHKASQYDPYCSGGGFTLSHDVINSIIPLFDWERPLKIDDAYIGKLVYKSGTHAKHNDGFYMWNNKCEYHDNVIVTHPVKELPCMKELQKTALSKSSFLKAINLDSLTEEAGVARGSS